MAAKRGTGSSGGPSSSRPPRSSSGSARALLQTIRQESRRLAEEMSFEEYLEMIRRSPRATRLSHELIYDAIRAPGVRKGPEGEPRYALFRDEVFGADEVIRQIVEYFAAAAARLDIRRRILLLVGPPGCGKSTIVNAIKAGLEEHTRAGDGAIYAIKECPVHEEPLHLIPRHLRDELEDIYIEGDLCPYCHWLVREVYKGDVARVPVRRITLSVAEGIGIGTFVATDPRSEDLTRLVGKVDTALLQGTDRGAARRAFRLDGELNAANRGLADLIEIFKMDERFLAVLLTLSQEQFIKISGPMSMYADEAIIAHSNLAEYESLIDDPKAAALQDRLVTVRVGYVLSVRDEVRIYEKLLGDAAVRRLRVSPLALPAAATLAVLTRLDRPRRTGWDLRKKLHLYDGRFVPDAGPEDLKEFRQEASEEGLKGISPRFVINQLSNEASRTEGCLSGERLLETMWQGLGQRAAYREEDREQWEQLFEIARAEHDDNVRRTLRRAFVPRFRQRAHARAQDVHRDLQKWARGKAEDELRSLRRLERALGVPLFRRQRFRESLLAELDAAGGGRDLHLADPRLEEAIDRELLPLWQEVGKTLLAQESGRAADRRDREDLRERLRREEGFPAACADDLIAYALRLASEGESRRGLGLFGGGH